MCPTLAGLQSKAAHGQHSCTAVALLHARTLMGHALKPGTTCVLRVNSAAGIKRMDLACRVQGMALPTCSHQVGNSECCAVVPLVALSG